MTPTNEDGSHRLESRCINISRMTPLRPTLKSDGSKRGNKNKRGLEPRSLSKQLDDQQKAVSGEFDKVEQGEAIKILKDIIFLER